MPDKKPTDNLSNNSPNLSNGLSDNEIKKALECCSKKICKQCPNFSEDIECGEKLIILALDLINRLQAENERLQKSNRNWRRKVQRLRTDLNVDLEGYASEYDNKIKAEAYKECIEKVKALFPSDNEPYQYWEIHEGADNLLKELTEKSN